MDALTRANEIRTRRAALKRDLKAGRAELEGLLVDPPEWLETAKVFDLLLAAPSFGRVRVNRVLTAARISPSKTLGGLSKRQRSELVELVRTYSGRSTRTTRSTDVAGETGLGERFISAVSRLVRTPQPGSETLDHAARLAVADEVWDQALGPLLTKQEVAEALGLRPIQLDELTGSMPLLELHRRDGIVVYPAFQFHDRQPLRDLIAAHAKLVHEGRTSPWTAASWAVTEHPELAGRTPAAWAADGQDSEQLLAVAARDAMHLAH